MLDKQGLFVSITHVEANASLPANWRGGGGASSYS